MLYADGAAGQDTLAAAAERAAALDSQHLAGQQLREVKQRQYTLHQELDQLKADVSRLLRSCGCCTWSCHFVLQSAVTQSAALVGRKASCTSPSHILTLVAHCLQIRKAGDDIVRQKREHRQAVIRRAHIVASTLVSAGGELKQLLPHNLLFDAIVIDEVTDMYHKCCCACGCCGHCPQLAVQCHVTGVSPSLPFRMCTCRQPKPSNPQH